MSGSDIQINLTETSEVKTETPAVEIVTPPSRSPCDWHIENKGDFICATCGAASFEGTIEQFNAYLRG